MKIIILLSAFFSSGLGWAGGSIVTGGLNDRAIEVSFYSPGNGIDLPTEDKLLSIIVDQLKGGKIVKLTTQPQGFEGDITFCLEFRSSELMSAAFPAIDDLLALGKNVSGKTASACR